MDRTLLTNAGGFRDWLVGRTATYLQCPPESIDTDVPLGEYGLDSVLALAIVSDIEDYLKIDLDETVLWDHPSIDKLVEFLGDV